jgi:hypothetical protein
MGPPPMGPSLSELPTMRASLTSTPPLGSPPQMHNRQSGNWEHWKDGQASEKALFRSQDYLQDYQDYLVYMIRGTMLKRNITN